MKTNRVSSFTWGSVLLSSALLAALALMGACASKPEVPEVVVLVDDSGSDPDAQVSFKNVVGPLLERRCVTCHYDNAQQTALSFQRRSSIIEESANRPILIPGDPEKSTLFLVTVMPEYFVEAMPPTGHRLSDAESASLFRWIAQGAKWPENLVLKPGPGT